MSSADDGPGYNVIFYFALSPETSAALSNLSTAPPAVKLLNEYFRWAHFHPFAAFTKGGGGMYYGYR